MPTIRQYYETDFSHAIRVHAAWQHEGDTIEGVILYDFAANCAFLACYVPEGKSEEYIERLLGVFDYGKSIEFTGKITLPKANQFPGRMRIDTVGGVKLFAKFDGNPWELSSATIQTTNRLFLYSASPLSEHVIDRVQKVAQKAGLDLQCRDPVYAATLTAKAKPLAFISHDSGDKDDVARPLAIGLQRLMCPVWYDEFSLKVGDPLRESIEKGLKECKKCVLVLSPRFFANRGWTKKEFDSIFTREVLEKTNLILPVWYGVTAKDVYEYSPSLANVTGLDWKRLGDDEVTRLLCRAITEP